MQKAFTLNVQPRIGTVQEVEVQAVHELCTTLEARFGHLVR